MDLELLGKLFGALVVAAAGTTTVWKLVSDKPIIPTLLRALGRTPANEHASSASGVSEQLAELAQRAQLAEQRQRKDAVIMQAYKQKQHAQAEAERKAALRELNSLAAEGCILLERAEHWKSENEQKWREDFEDFAQRLDSSASKHLPAGTALNLTLECKAIRQASWPAFVSVTERIPGQVTVQRGTLPQAVERLLRALASAMEAMVQAPLELRPVPFP